MGAEGGADDRSSLLPLVPLCTTRRPNSHAARCVVAQVRSPVASRERGPGRTAVATSAGLPFHADLLTVSSGRRLTLPNIITLARIAVCPVLFLLTMAMGASARFGAFSLFVVAALSDVWDGYLARKHGWITDMGKLLDPLADKLLLAATFVPFYFVSHRPGDWNEVPFWGPLPLWVLLVIFGRELLITVFRYWARRRGVVIAAGRSGKNKALSQNLFMGALLLWYPLLVTARARGWVDNPVWSAWSWVHSGFIALTLLVALILTVYSMIDYLWSYRSLVGVRD